MKNAGKLLSIGLLSLASTLSVASSGPEVDLNTKDVRAGNTPMANLIRIPAERTAITDNIFLVSGLANVYLINTPEGAIVVDTGFAHQAPGQMAKIKEVLTGPVKYIFLPQGQHDDIGGIPLITEEGTQIIMTRNSMEYMVHRKKAGPFLLPRYAALYSWAPQLQKKASEKTKTKNPFPYEPITPDILVEDETGYQFELGGTQFEIISLPGAEGINSAGLWMPREKVLFTGGGAVGPDFPMWPNIGTVRSDRNRILTEYLNTINKIIALEPEMLLTGQNHVVLDKGEIMAGLILLRDAAQYVHDEIWKGLGESKDAYQLAREIKLPKEMAHLNQQHGRVEWTVRETVAQTGAWFPYKYTSELYPYRPHEIYPELLAMAGEDKVLAQSGSLLKGGEPERALLMVEVALAGDENSEAALELQIDILTVLLERAKTTHNTFSEVAWLQAQIGKAKARLAG